LEKDGKFPTSFQFTSSSVTLTSTMQHCTTVPSNQWQTGSTSNNAGGFGGASQQLYARKATA
jgi:hypothetical protein